MKKLLIVAMAVAMMLAGCGEKKEENNIQSAEKIEITTQFEDASLQEAYEYIFTQQGETKEAEEFAMSQVNMVQDNLKVVEKLGIDLTEQLEAAKTANGGQEGIDAAVEQGIPQGFIDVSLQYQASYQAISDYMEANGLFSEVDGKEYFMENYWRAKHILIQTEGMSDDEKAEAKKKAEDFLAQAKEGADFDALVAEHSEDPGSQSQPDGYVFTTGTMVQEFEDGVKNIEIGEFNLVETSYGYHVIKRLAIDETQELYDKFYSESGVEEQIKSEAVAKFIEEQAK